ncbi:MAG: SUMF1/EgtB/PvdO family nonheme iron enzyme [bacterium]|nr:SUMF1/EgtB/PvdO family nonheme iron enzyme [bacterium]
MPPLYPTRLKYFALTGLIIVLALAAYGSMAQTEPRPSRGQQANPQPRVIVEDAQLTVVVAPAPDAVSLRGFGFQVQIDGVTRLYLLNDYPVFAPLTDFTPTPVCFRLIVTDAEAEAPAECADYPVLNQAIAPDARFWVDAATDTRRTLVLVNAVITPLAICGVEQSRCGSEAASTTAALQPATITRNADWQPMIETVNGIEMALVPPGCFTMGTTDEQRAIAMRIGESSAFIYDEERPAHAQCLEQPYWIGVTEVTNAQYPRCVRAEVCDPPGDGALYRDPARADHPVVHITWDQARRFAAWWGGRLATEREWEYAARGVDSLLFPWGNTFDPSAAAWCANQAACGDLSPVGAFPHGASWVGALDMSGNAWEWVSTIYDQAVFPYPYRPDDGREAIPGTVGIRGLRGGSVSKFTVNALRGSERNYSPVSALPYPQEIGFRLAWDDRP